MPIVGAGFSRNANYQDGEAPVDWAGLGSSLGQAVHGASTDATPIESISAYEQAFGRVALVDKVGTLIRAHRARPGRAHLAFARVGFTDVVTTNFDFLLEKSYDEVLKGCMPVIDEAQLSAPNRSAGPRVIKFHGDLHHPSRLVLTEDDYDRFLLAYPLLATSVSAMLIDHTGILIGYSLDDPDTRQLLALLNLRLGNMRRPLWTIQFDAKPSAIARFERRGVKVVNLPLRRGETRSDGFARLFLEIADYWRAKVSAASVSTDDRVAADLQLPADDARRLCLFTLPPTLVGWYRENVFPEFEAHGLVPVVSREVISAPGAVATKLDALIERSLLVVVELDGGQESYEAAVALARKGRESVLLIKDDRDFDRGVDTGRLPVRAVDDVQVLMRPSVDADPVEFLARIRNWLSVAAPDVATHRDEPIRLLASHHYGPALVSAVSLLEVALSRALDGKREVPVRSSLRNLVREANRVGLISSGAELRSVEDAITKRNEIVHRIATVTPQQARAGVKVIMPILQRADDW